MAGESFIVFALGIAVMLACAIACGEILRRLRQPAVLGEMLGGIVLGPAILGSILPHWQAALFPNSGTVAVALEGLLKLGMLFFLFLVGLDIRLSDVRSHSRPALSIGLMGSLIPLAAAAAMVYLLPGWWGERAAGSQWTLALFLGAALANTANPVLARVLLDLGLLQKRLGAILMTSTIVDDVIGWSLMVIALGSAQAPAGGRIGLVPQILGVALFYFGVLLCTRLLGRPLLRWSRRRLLWPQGFLSSAIVMVLVSAAAAEWLGLHAFLGPFLVGLALAPTAEEREDAYNAMTQFVSSFFVPLYFVSLGLTCDFRANFDLPFVLMVLGVASASKLSGAYIGARMGGFSNRTSWAIGFGMNTRGVIGLLLAALGREAGIIDERTYVALVVTTLVTSLLAGPMMRLLLRQAPSKELQDAATAG